MKQVPTVYELRKRGWKVRVGHHRRFYRYDPYSGKRKEYTLLFKEKEDRYPDYFLAANGGYTEVMITVPDIKGDFTGVSVCSLQELYCKKVGTKKAIARALSMIIDGGYLENYN